MTDDRFAEALVKAVKDGKPMDAAIGQAAKECGLRSITLPQVMKVVASRPNDFPPAYRRLMR